MALRMTQIRKTLLALMDEHGPISPRGAAELVPELNRDNVWQALQKADGVLWEECPGSPGTYRKLKPAKQ